MGIFKTVLKKVALAAAVIVGKRVISKLLDGVEANPVADVPAVKPNLPKGATAKKSPVSKAAAKPKVPEAATAKTAKAKTATTAKPKPAVKKVAKPAAKPKVIKEAPVKTETPATE